MIAFFSWLVAVVGLRRAGSFSLEMPLPARPHRTHAYAIPIARRRCNGLQTAQRQPPVCLFGLPPPPVVNPLPASSPPSPTSPLLLPSSHPSFLPRCFFALLTLFVLFLTHSHTHTHTFLCCCRIMVHTAGEGFRGRHGAIRCGGLTLASGHRACQSVPRPFHFTPLLASIFSFLVGRRRSSASLLY